VAPEVSGRRQFAFTAKAGRGAGVRQRHVLCRGRWRAWLGHAIRVTRGSHECCAGVREVVGWLGGGIGRQGSARCARAVPSGDRNRGRGGGPVEGMTSRSHLSSAAGKGTSHMTCPCAGRDRGPVWWLVGPVGLGWLSFPLSYFLFFFYFFLYYVTLLSCI